MSDDYKVEYNYNKAKDHRRELDDLVGLAFEYFAIDKSRDLLLMQSVGGSQWYLHTYADCCSRSWIEHIEGIENIVHSPIISVHENKMSRLDYTTAEGFEHCLQTYNLVIKTFNGLVTIDFRNESNGYYGASLLLSEGWPVYDYDVIIDSSEIVDFKKITEDF